MRVLATMLAAVLVSCTAAVPSITPTPSPTREPDTLFVSVLLDLSGTRSPNGQAQRNAMELWLTQTQTSRSAVKIRVKFVDIGGSDARLVLELRRAVVDDHADAIVVGVPETLDETFARAAQVAAVPVLLTMPAAEPTASGGGPWIFALAPTPDTISRVLVDDLIGRGVRAPSLLVTDETPAAVVERTAYTAELGRRGYLAPAPIVSTQPDAAANIRSGAAVAKSVVFAGATGAYGDAIRAMPLGVDAPRVYLSYLTETADVTALRDQSAIVTWPGSRSLASLSSTATTGARAAFVQAFGARYGAPSTIAATAYDALAMIDAAAEPTPVALDAAHLRARLDTLTFAGIVTHYSFAPTRHVGFSSDDLAYLRWNTQRNAPFLASDVKGEAK